MVDIATSNGIVETSNGEGTQRRLRPFDFRNPTKLPRDHVRKLELTHEVFTRAAGNEWSTLLRTMVRLELLSIDQFTYDEYVRSMPNPTVIAQVTLDPLPGVALLEMSTQTGLTLVDRMLGGLGRPGSMRRPTELEGSLLAELIGRLLPAFAETFEPLLTVAPAIAGVEFNPHFVQAANPSEMVAVLTYSLSIVQGVASEGLITVCYPFSQLAPALELAHGEPDGTEDAEVPPSFTSPLAGLLSGVAVPIAVRLRTSEVPAADVAGLAAGDVLRLDHKVDEKVLGVVAGIDLLEGRVGRKGKHLALEMSNWRSDQ